MHRKNILFIGLLILISGFGLIWASSAGARMIKEVALGVMAGAPSQTELDRFYMRYHGPEIMRLSGPWLTRYQLWLPYEPPEVAVERFGAVKGRYAELWYREDDYLDRPALKGMTKPIFPGEGRDQTAVTVPANPTDEFYDSDPHPEQTTILRWVTVIRYPEGVSLEEGEKWFLEVHAKEAVKQPGLLKFVSHKVLAELNEKAMAKMIAEGMDLSSGEMSLPKSWVRVSEYWYKDFDAWSKAVLESPPKYTVPSWGGEYPFVEMVSTFIPYMHDVDFIKGNYIVP